jgi:lipoprotein LprG
VLILRRTALSVVLATAAAVTLAGCGGGSNTVTLTPDKAVALAKNTFDDTSAVHVQLKGDDLPDGNVLVSADGTLTRAPAFDGRIGVKVLGATAQVPVIAVDDKVYAKLPLTVSWQTIDPATYGVPDPASLIDPDTGISHLLTATTGLKRTGTERGGKDNKQILTTYTGQLPAEAVASIIASASGTFDVTYTIDDDHQLHEAELTGRFYGADEKPSTYVVSLDDYGVEKTITAP